MVVQAEREQVRRYLGTLRVRKEVYRRIALFFHETLVYRARADRGLARGNPTVRGSRLHGTLLVLLWNDPAAASTGTMMI